MTRWDVNQSIRLRAEHLQHAERDTGLARHFRKRLLADMARRERQLWETAFYEPQARENSQHWVHTFRTPTLEEIGTLADRVIRLERDAEESLQLARYHQDQIARRQRKAREEPGLWTLLRVCWRGWLNCRAA